MPTFSQIGKIAGITLGVAAGVAGAGALAALRRPLPRASGRLPLAGLEAPVTVIRDRWGVPHIYARSNTDLFMAQGYVHAQDRLWQMELHRRTGYGQLAEIFGSLALEADRFLRVLGLGRVARREVESLTSRTRAELEAYVQGVNAFIERNAGRLPIEFSILRTHPRPWEPADVLVWGKMMAFSLSGNWSDELLRARILATLGPERAAALEPRFSDDHPLVIPRGARYTPTIGAEALRASAEAERFAGPAGQGQGSNNWVVNGARSATGKPLLASDPHLAIQIPSIWYENHLNGGDYHVTGASFPGVPGVIIGHNERIAWGVTNGMNDVQDLYIERFDPDDPTRYEFRGAWEQAEVVREEIIVRGESAPVIQEVRITRHGPIITPLIPAPNQEADAPLEQLALRWTALEPGSIYDAVLALNRAHDWESFRGALEQWTTPSQNFVYADVRGHVGYTLAGAIPIRARGDGRLPVPGWSGEYEWTGVIPAAELPHALDPDEGFVVTANNRIAGDDYPHPLPAEWLSGYRAARIQTLIEQTPRHDADSFARIQRDLHSLPGLALAALADRLPVHNVVAQHARDALAAWDGELTTTSVGGTIYARLRERLVAAAYAEAVEPLGLVVGLGLFATLPSATYLVRAVPDVLRRAAARDNSWLPAGRDWDALLAEAWEGTVAELRAEYGDDVSTWRYGRFHHFTFRHALGVVPGLARLFNRGPFPAGGDSDTVCMGNLPRQFAGPPYFAAPSYRQICDVADWDASRSIHATGQSGHPGSRHYADFIAPWLNAHYHPMLWSRAQVERAAAQRLTLEPATQPGTPPNGA